MIQRIQTVYLLLAGLLLALVGILFLLQGLGDAPASEQTFPVAPAWVALAMGPLTLAGGAVALRAIFLFNRRKRQMLGAQVVIVLGIVALGLNLLAPVFENGRCSAIVAVVVAVAVVLTAMAKRRIRKDEELVRSMDRIR